MLILVHGNGFKLESDLRGQVHERIQSSLARFKGQIGKVNAYLADLNGPKNGIDKSIRLVIEIERQPTIVIEEKGEGWTALFGVETYMLCLPWPTAPSASWPK